MAKGGTNMITRFGTYNKKYNIQAWKYLGNQRPPLKSNSKSLCTYHSTWWLATVDPQMFLNCNSSQSLPLAKADALRRVTLPLFRLWIFTEIKVPTIMKSSKYFHSCIIKSLLYEAEYLIDSGVFSLVLSVHSSPTTSSLNSLFLHMLEMGMSRKMVIHDSSRLTNNEFMDFSNKSMNQFLFKFKTI